MKTKVCFKCFLEKDISQYYKHPKMADGYLGKCKSCTKNDSKLITQRVVSTPEGLDKERSRHRNKYYRLGYKDLHKPSKENKKIAMNKYRKKYPEKVFASNKRGNLKALILGNELHHWSYNKDHYKDTIELSVKDHSFLHRYIKYDQERMMYRTLEGILLDTKENHIEYFNKVKNIYYNL